MIAVYHSMPMELLSYTPWLLVRWRCVSTHDMMEPAKVLRRLRCWGANVSYYIQLLLSMLSPAAQLILATAGIRKGKWIEAERVPYFHPASLILACTFSSS